MRFVPDSNILISAFFWGGVPGKILELTRRNDYTLLSSEALLDELLDVLRREKFAERLHRINKTPIQFLQDYRTLVEVVDVMPLPEPICDDPDDDAILACALSGEADVIVSGDNDLLRLKMVAGIPIMKPVQFLSQINSLE